MQIPKIYTFVGVQHCCLPENAFVRYRTPPFWEKKGSNSWQFVSRKFARGICHTFLLHQTLFQSFPNPFPYLPLPLLLCWSFLLCMIHPLPVFFLQTRDHEFTDSAAHLTYNLAQSHSAIIKSHHTEWHCCFHCFLAGKSFFWAEVPYHDIEGLVRILSGLARAFLENFLRRKPSCPQVRWLHEKRMIEARPSVRDSTRTSNPALQRLQQQCSALRSSPRSTKRVPDLPFPAENASSEASSASSLEEVSLSLVESGSLAVSVQRSSGGKPKRSFLAEADRFTISRATFHSRGFPGRNAVLVPIKLTLTGTRLARPVLVRHRRRKHTTGTSNITSRYWPGGKSTATVWRAVRIKIRFDRVHRSHRIDRSPMALVRVWEALSCMAHLGELDREFRCSSFFLCWSGLFELCCLSCFFNAHVESATQVILCAKRRSWMKQKKRGGKWRGTRTL